MSIEAKRTTVRNIFTKYTGFSRREAERVVREADDAVIETIVNASPEEAEMAVKQVFESIRIAEGKAIQDQQIKAPDQMLDGDIPVVVDEPAAEDDGPSPAAGLDADE